jgi:hypothetical protein
VNSTLDEPDDRFEVRPSTIPGAGFGVFARCEFSAGDALEVRGIVIKRESVADRCTHFADRHKFRLGDELLIPIGLGGLVNHSAEPNLEKVIVGRRIFLRAIRTIAAGEELFFRYPDAALERFGLPR